MFCFWLVHMTVKLRAHIQDTCNCGRTYNKHAIKNASTRDMWLELHLQETISFESHLQIICNQNHTYMQSRTHLQETCNWNSIYKRHVIGIAPTINMWSELHLPDWCYCDCTCNKQWANVQDKCYWLIWCQFTRHLLWTNLMPSRLHL